MGPHVVVLPNDTEVPIVKAGEVTSTLGKDVHVGRNVHIKVTVLENVIGHPSSVRAAVTDHGHRDDQLYYGNLPELGNVDFMTSIGRVSVFNKEI